MKTNIFRVKKPHDSIIDEMICKGVGVMDNRSDPRKWYGRWMHLERVKKETKAIRIENIKWNKFAIIPQKKIIKDEKHLSKKYSYYKIL